MSSDPKFTTCFECERVIDMGRDFYKTSRCEICGAIYCKGHRHACLLRQSAKREGREG